MTIVELRSPHGALAGRLPDVGPEDIGPATVSDMWPQNCDTLTGMTTADAHTVGLRDLRHHTSEVLARVRHGETIDVTDHGRLIARIVPVEHRTPTPVLARLVASGRASLARRPGYRPRLRPGDGADTLSGTVAAMRADERW